MTHATEQGVLNAQYNTEIERQITAQKARTPHVLMRPSIFLDGDKWCLLYGENLQEGVAGFGDTPEQAALDFDANWIAATVSTTQSQR